MNSFGNSSLQATVSKISIEQRQAESPLATPSYRSDIYNILHKKPRQSLLNNLLQNVIDTPSKPDQVTKSNALFTIASNTSFRSNNTNDSVIKLPPPLKKTYLYWLFKMPQNSLDQSTFNDYEFITTPDNPDDAMCDITLQALSVIGGTNEASIAVTEAFEKLLTKEYIPWWTPEDIASLSIPFIAAFSRLLGGLDLSHAIKSRVIKPKDIALLISIPHIKTNIMPILELYQDPNP